MLLAFNVLQLCTQKTSILTLETLQLFLAEIGECHPSFDTLPSQLVLLFRVLAVPLGHPSSAPHNQVLLKFSEEHVIYKLEQHGIYREFCICTPAVSWKRQ